MSSKRLRTPSPSHISQSSLETTEPVSKATRTAPLQSSSKSSQNLLCTLPPTCNPPNRPTPLANSKELETHYATYHAHVCEEAGCGCVFPDARLLELHQTECHDPIAALRKDRGEKIFACHLSTCSRMFGSPKTRRLHLIQAHGYPKEYFFAVTNKGVGGLLKKWGEGASMVRRAWKARESQEGEDDSIEDEDDDELDGENSSNTPGRETTIASRLDEGPLVEEDDEDDTDECGVVHDSSVDDLAVSMDTLSLVPAAIRFGRGAKRGGVAHHDSSHGHKRGHAPRNPRPHEDSRAQAHMEIDSHPHSDRGTSSRRGRGQHGSRPGGETHAYPPVPPRGIGAGRRGMIFGRGRIAIGRGIGGRGGRGRG